jgi:hypothetical protein
LRQSGWAEGDSGLRSRDHQSDPQDASRAAPGIVTADDIEPVSRERVTSMLQRDGSRFLGPAGPLTSLTLLADTMTDGKRVRRYRSLFASGLSILWTVELTAAGKLVALSPRPE